MVPARSDVGSERTGQEHPQACGPNIWEEGVPWRTGGWLWVGLTWGHGGGGECRGRGSEARRGSVGVGGKGEAREQQGQVRLGGMIKGLDFIQSAQRPSREGLV